MATPPSSSAGSQTRSPGFGQVFLGAAELPAIERQEEHLASVYRLSDPGLSDLPLEQLLEEVLLRVREILGTDTVALLLLDESTGELVARAAKGIEEEVERGVRIPLGQGFAGRIAAGRTPIFIADVDHADVLNPILRQKGIRSLLGVPLIIESRVVGVMHVGSLVPREFTNTDAVLLQLAASRVAPAIERAELADALEREHRGAVALQRSLLPDELPRVSGIDVAARYLPARDEVGGDWYDVLEFVDGRLGLVIGDVAGHGIRAAALMGQLRTGLRAYAIEGNGPGETLRRLDDLLQTMGGRGMATIAYAVVDPENGSVTMASAGHLPPVLTRAGGGAALVEVPRRPPLGTVPFATYPELDFQLDPGDSLVLYTDGLVETRSSRLVDRLDALREVAESSDAGSAERLCHRVVRQMLGPFGADDDVAVVVMRREPISTELRLQPSADPAALAGIRRSLRRWLHQQGAEEEVVRTLTLAAGEACANAIEHANAPGEASFDVEAVREGDTVTLTVRDQGRWRQPRGEHRGRGLKLIEASVDELALDRTEGGTRIVMRRRLEP